MNYVIQLSDWVATFVTLCKKFEVKHPFWCDRGERGIKNLSNLCDVIYTYRAAKIGKSHLQREKLKSGGIGGLSRGCYIYSITLSLNKSLLGSGSERQIQHAKLAVFGSAKNYFLM